MLPFGHMSIPGMPRALRRGADEVSFRAAARNLASPRMYATKRRDPSVCTGPRDDTRLGMTPVCVGDLGGAVSGLLSTPGHQKAIVAARCSRISAGSLSRE